MSPELDRIAALETKVDALSRDMATLLARGDAQADLFRELGPILKAVTAAGIHQLDDLEGRGYFGFGRGLLHVLDQVVSRYSEAEVRELGDNIVTILDTVRALTQPEVLAVAAKAAEGLDSDVESQSLWGMLRTSQDADVRRGMAVAFEVLRHVGRGVRPRAPISPLQSRLASRLAPRRADDRSRQPALEAPRAPRSSRPPQAPPPSRPQRAATAAAQPATEAEAASLCPDPSAWSREVAVDIAVSFGLSELSPAHWHLVDTARSAFLESGASPNIRKLTQLAGVPTRDIYQLFPTAPGKTIAAIAGIPKPAGCI